jgi:hypothetical protein
LVSDTNADTHANVEVSMIATPPALITGTHAWVAVALSCLPIRSSNIPGNCDPL